MILSIILILMSHYSLCVLTIRDVNLERYNSGKSQYELMQERSKMPMFSQCWHRAILQTESTCKELTDQSQARLALHYLNCFNQIQGRDPYPCDSSDDMAKCSKQMSDADRASYTTFFTHANNICYFLQSQAWNEQTEKTISRLADSSDTVADQLEMSSSLQKEMIGHQNVSINNQKMLIHHANNLSSVLVNSSTNIEYMNSMLNEFNRTTSEHRSLLMDVFKKLTQLQSFVVEEFSGFYSLFFYFISIIITYFLTATQRTQGARFTLFILLSFNILLEHAILQFYEADGHSLTQTLMYTRQWQCREVTCLIGIVILFIHAFRYRDINVANNELLLHIRKQNSELLKQLASGHTPVKQAIASVDQARSSVVPDNLTYGTPSRSRQTVSPTTEVESAGYCSDATSSDSESDSGSDCTFILPNDADLDNSEIDSFYASSPSRRWSRSSTPAHMSSRSSTPSLLDELSFLRDSTPFREIIGHFCDPDDKNASTASNNTMSNKDLPSHGYNLRSRKGVVHNPIVNDETERDFSKTVRNLARVANKNSRLVRQAQQRNKDLGPSSDDETHKPLNESDNSLYGKHQ